MTDLKLFRIKDTTVSESSSAPVTLERNLQVLFEKNLESLLGVRFVASEFSTSHGGRIDTLGIDENNCPVIIEYKRDRNENVINQGLFYLDWLMDHRRDFEWQVMEVVGKQAAEQVEWSTPRLICVAADFTKYDVHAVNQMNRNIELIRYRMFEKDLLVLEQLTAITTTSAAEKTLQAKRETAALTRTLEDHLGEQSEAQRRRFDALKTHLLALGDDVQIHVLKHYIAFRRIKNFAAVEFRSKHMLVFVKGDTESVTFEPGFTRDVSNLGHHGTGSIEITISKDSDIEKAKPLLLRSYEDS